MPIIVDRRKNIKGKSTTNRNRFIKRAKDAIRESLKDKIQGRKIGNTTTGENINIPSEGIQEPAFGHDYNTGKKTDVRPGNKTFNRGDKIKKPPSGGGSGGNGSGQGSDSDELSEDSFEFAISKKEFYDLFFEDLELPNLADKEMVEIKHYKYERQGFRTDGSMANLDINRSYKQSLARRTALKRPHRKEMSELENQIENEPDQSKKDELIIKLNEMKRKFKKVPFFDYQDLRFRHFEQVPRPNNKAVMFCIMDVSASMGEHEKDLAKRFFMLLYMFLERKYEKTEIVFIKHHTTAVQCTEDEFFHDKESGGTTVSSAMELTMKVIKDKYPIDQWNIYCAQCSDGDNCSSEDSKICTDIISKQLMPICQYFAYIQTEYSRRSYGNTYLDSEYSLWSHYEVLKDSIKNFDMKQVSEVSDIWKVFVELFKKRNV